MSKTDETVYLNDRNDRKDSSEEKTEYVNGKIVDANKTEYVGKNFTNDQKADGVDTKTEYIGTNSNAYERSAKVEIESPNNMSGSLSGETKIVDGETTYYLPINTILQGRYRIDSVLGEGGFGITYKGLDLTLNISVAIKEYYPSGIVTRNVMLGRTTEVKPISQEKYGTQFTDGIDKVLDEARRMAKFRNTEGIVAIYDFFKANSTAYIVMEYIEGSTLEDYCKSNRVECTTLFNMLVPVMDALQALHDEGLIHRDVSPDNIMVDKKGNYKLLDFGAARGYSEELPTTMSIILKTSYAPEEQYRSKGNQGPWTDVYALGATIYYLISGEMAPNSIDRLVEDDIVDIQNVAPSLTKGQAEAIMKALAVRANDRWQTVRDFKEALIASAPPKVSNDLEIQSDNKRVSHDSRKKVIFFGVFVVLVLIILGVLGTSSIWGSSKESVTENTLDTKYEHEIETVSYEQTKSDNKGYKNDSAIVNDNKLHPGYFGVKTSDIPEEIGIDNTNVSGCFISEVIENTPAFSAGFMEGDIIIAINDASITTKKDFSTVLREYYAGDKLIIGILREDNGVYTEQSKELVLADRHNYCEQGSAYMGITTTDIPQEVIDNYGVRSGAYITSLASEFPAAEAGLSKDDIIIKLDETDISTKNDFSDALQQYYGGDRIKVQYLHLDGNKYLQNETVVYTVNDDDVTTTVTSINTVPVEKDVKKEMHSSETVDGIVTEYPDMYYANDFAVKIKDVYLATQKEKYIVYIIADLVEYTSEKDIVPNQSRRIYYYLYDENDRIIDDDFALTGMVITQENIGEELIFDDTIFDVNPEDIAKVVIK